ncbi:multicopper oxidase family protein [Hypericibacter sp.]|uniref:multicopper oxidase family protein n=1 Tax=Hypericibacter sp. TaxID=2705401 RepID=UPI003D6D2874
MASNRNFLWSRRALLGAGAGLVLGTALSPWPTRAADGARRLSAASGQAFLLGKDRPATQVWAYDDQVPGPVLRFPQGKPVRITFENRLEEGTTIHWHGIRLPIGMDGVPGISQPPIKPGETFVYEFTPPDAGTFWYHPHVDSLRQIGRGLSGALIIEEQEPPVVDRDLLWMLADWRMTDDGQIAAGFGNPMEAMMSGRIGNTVTLNGRVSAGEPVRAGERIRLRLVNGALARIMALRFEGHRPMIVAIDGQPCDPHEPKDGRLLLGPAMRMDVIIDMQGEPGRRYRVTDDFYDELAYALTELAYDTEQPMRTHPLDAPHPLPPNPLPEPDLAAAERHELVLQGGMMGGGAMAGLGGMAGGGMMGGGNGMSMAGMGSAGWAINGSAMTGDGQAGMPPLLTLKLGRSYLFTLRNQTAWWHPMHLHGHSFRVLSRNGTPVPHREWGDTVLVSPREAVEIAFVADNPGDWMLHCHVIDHQMAGLMTILRIA